MKTPSPSPAWHRGAAPVAIFLLLLWLLSARFELPAAPMDEGTLLVYPEQILNGKLPYRDFETFYGPANPYLLAAVYAVTGPGIFAERAVGLCYRLALLVGIFVLARRWGNNIAAGCVLLAGVFVVPTNLVAYAWMGGVACAVWFLWAATSEGGIGRRFFAGVLAAAALLFRPDLSVAIGLAGIAVFVIAPATERKGLVAGFACGLLPLAALAVAAGPMRIYESLFFFPVLQNRRTLSTETAGKWMHLLLALHFVGTALAIGAGWSAHRTLRHDRRGLVLMLLGLCALGCSHQALQRLDPTHLFFACFLGIAILPLGLLAMVERTSGPAVGESRPLLAVAVVLLAVALTSPAMITCMHQAIGFAAGTALAPTRYLRWNARAFPLPSDTELARTTDCLLAVQRHAQPGERLLVGPGDLRHTDYNDTFLYHLLPQLTPATYFLEMNPGSANREGSSLAADVASADWLILNKHWDTPKSADPTPTPTSNAAEIVRTQFTLVRATHGFEVYRKTAPLARN